MEKSTVDRRDRAATSRAIRTARRRRKAAMARPAPRATSAATTISGSIRASASRVVDGQRRSSLIIDPPDGRVPALTPKRARASRRAPRRRWAAASTIIPSIARSPSAACCRSARPRRSCRITSTTTTCRSCRRRDHVMILMEMVHDARIVRIGGTAPAETHPAVDGRFDRPLGRRHAGRRHHQLPAAAELPRRVREPACRRALPPRRRQHHQLPVHGGRPDDVYGPVYGRDSVPGAWTS